MTSVTILATWPLVRTRTRRFFAELRRIEHDTRSHVAFVVVSERQCDGLCFEIRVPSSALEALRNAADAAIAQLRADDARTRERGDNGPVRPTPEDGA